MSQMCCEERATAQLRVFRIAAGYDSVFPPELLCPAWKWIAPRLWLDSSMLYTVQSGAFALGFNYWLVLLTPAFSSSNVSCLPA